MRNRLWLLILPLLLFSACGEEQYTTVPGATPQGGGGAVTGILINAQVPPDQTKLGPFENWKVADLAGNVIFESSQVTASSYGVPWEFRYGKATGWDGKYALGSNFIEVKIVKNAVNSEQTAVDFYVGDAGKAALQGIPNLSELIRRGKFLMLVGHVGD